jgi:hypothetical protein
MGFDELYGVNAKMGKAGCLQIGHIVLANNNRVRLFWAFLVIVSFAAFVYLLLITLLNYLAYKTDVNLNVC